MTKVLRNVLVIGLGLLTTVSYAQSIDVESRTRIDMSNDFGGDDKMLTDQRVTTSVSFGGSNWGIYMSNDFNYTLGAGGGVYGAADPMASIYEAYASTDLMGFANMTIGRQALSYGSGALMSTNDWGSNRTTWDGAKFDFNLDAVSLSLGYANTNLGLPESDDNNRTWANIGGNFSGFDVNVLYMSQELPAAGMLDAETATGIDISGEIAGANIMASLNSDFSENTMTMLGLTYAVNDDMSINVSQTMYDEENDGHFYMVGTNMDSYDAATDSYMSWSRTGNIGYLDAGMQDLTIGLSYDMGAISLGASMHTITAEDNAEYGEDWERQATEINLGYNFNDNASLGLSLISDDMGTDADATFTYVTLTITP